MRNNLSRISGNGLLYSSVECLSSTVTSIRTPMRGLQVQVSLASKMQGHRHIAFFHPPLLHDLGITYVGVCHFPVSNC